MVNKDEYKTTKSRISKQTLYTFRFNKPITLKTMLESVTCCHQDLKTNENSVV